jgi:hypothetical protein
MRCFCLELQSYFNINYYNLAEKQVSPYIDFQILVDFRDVIFWKGKIKLILILFDLNNR